VYRLLSELRAIVVPPVCMACRTALPAAEEVVCADCRRALVWLTAPLCRRCGMPEPCSPCPGRRASYLRAWAPLSHEGVARTLVRALKYDARLALADSMAAQMAAGAPGGLLSGGVLVPVPAERSRRRTKGFDHAERLAAALGARTGLPVWSRLRRRGRAPHQAGAPRAERLATRRLLVQATARAPPLAILVDDVHTTGATLDACGRALLAAGAEQVNAITYTRALRR
jgi:predicted amidophosphoribosyltransferase